MKTFLIGYDLNKKGQDYETLIEEIKKLSLDGWWHCLDSTWILKSNMTASGILDHLRKFMDSNDELLVIELQKGVQWASFFGEECNEWLQENL